MISFRHQSVRSEAVADSGMLASDGQHGKAHSFRIKIAAIAPDTSRQSLLRYDATWGAEGRWRIGAGLTSRRPADSISQDDKLKIAV
jgi:hypothetical protein